MYHTWAIPRVINRTLVASSALGERIASASIIKVCRVLYDVKCTLLKFSWDKDEKNTTETVDAEGWVHTGDVAEIDSCGRIKIVDRVKVLHFCPSTFFKLSITYSLEYNETLPRRIRSPGED